MVELKENSFFCPFCGEQILKNARICRFCKNGVTYDLYVFKIPGDQRRGEIARKLFETTQTEFFSSFGAIRKALENDNAPFAQDLTQENVESITKTLSHFDVGFEQSIHEKSRSVTSKTYDYRGNLSCDDCLGLLYFSIQNQTSLGSANLPNHTR
ncbi:MAG: hypothetical protein R2877_00710 [Bdellovibrionota bacterium]